MLEKHLPQPRRDDQPRNRPTSLLEALESIWGNASVFQDAGLPAPAVDVTQTDQDIVVRAELPGLAPADVEVDLTEEVLTLKGEKKQERQEQGEEYERMERSYGAFTRAIALPAKVLTDQAQARFENGVLSVRLPKAQPGPVRRSTRILIE